MIRCCSNADLGREIAEFEPELVISCVPPPNPNTGDPVLLDGDERYIWVPAGCDDIYNQQLISYKNAVRRALSSFAGGKTLVHCKLGLSRSAALAVALVYKHDPEDVGPWLDANPDVQPNPLLLMIADEELGADFDLLRRCRGRWKGAQL